jgi:hypothetical protein
LPPILSLFLCPLFALPFSFAVLCRTDSYVFSRSTQTRSTPSLPVSFICRARGKSAASSVSNRTRMRSSVDLRSGVQTTSASSPFPPFPFFFSCPRSHSFEPGFDDADTSSCVALEYRPRSNGSSLDRFVPIRQATLAFLVPLLSPPPLTLLAPRPYTSHAVLFYLYVSRHEISLFSLAFPGHRAFLGCTLHRTKRSGQKKVRQEPSKNS